MKNLGEFYIGITLSSRKAFKRTFLHLVLHKKYVRLCVSLPLWQLRRLAKNLYMCSALVTKYQKQIPGPLLDRIDIHIEVPRVDYEKLSGDRVGESSAAIRARVKGRARYSIKALLN